MFDVSRLFGKGIRNTLLLKNGLQLSYNGPYVVVGTDTVMDQFHVNTFCTAEYTMSVDYDTNNKEILGTDVKSFFNDKNFKVNEKNKPRIFLWF